MDVYDVAVIGSGPGGYVAAVRAAQAGLSVCVIEKEHVGGTCLQWGCIPTKTLTTSAMVAEQVRKAKEWGVHVAGFSIDGAEVMARKHRVIRALGGGIQALFKAHKIAFFQDYAEICDAHHILLQRAGTRIQFKHAIIATGTRPVVPPVFQKDIAGILDVQGFLAQKTLPASVLIVGGGAIGCEFASILSACGVSVTVVEAMDRLLPDLDVSVSDALATILRRKKVQLKLGEMVSQVEETSAGIVAQGKDGALGAFETVLVAVGGRPALDFVTSGLQLATTPQGFVAVDDMLKTSVDSIYAVGDITGKAMLAHVASYQARVAVGNIAGKRKKADYRAVPWVIFTEPEIACVGLREEEARMSCQVRVVTVPLAGFGRAKSMGERYGFVKVIADSDTNTLLGVHMLGHGVSEYISQAVCYIQTAMKIEAICDMIYPHPTFSEALFEAIAVLGGQAVHHVEEPS